MFDLIGRTISNRYRVDSLLGRGGMGDVYKVWDSQRGVFLAMKVLHADLAEDRVFLRRFAREAETLSALQHPHIVRFYGLEKEGRVTFMLMDYIEGTTLRGEIFDAHKPFTIQQVLRILKPVCSALHYAHQMGRVHCDIKPANIMVRSNGEVLIADFGIARMMENSTTTTMAGAGTPAYMAPEQVLGKNPSPQTDVYALGIVLYEMLTGGERPFTGEQAPVEGSTSERVRWEQITLNPPSPRKYNSHISLQLEAVVMKCLEKKPEDRYVDVFSLLNAFTKDNLQESVEVEEQPQPIVSILVKKNEEIKRDTSEKLITPQKKNTSPLVWLIGSTLVIVLGLSVLINEFNPFALPTYTMTVTQVQTLLPRSTFTPNATVTPIATDTTISQVTSPALVFGKVNANEGGGANLRQTPNGKFLITLSNNTIVEVYPEFQLINGVMWIHVFVTHNGQRFEGWMLEGTVAYPIPGPSFEIFTPTIMSVPIVSLTPALGIGSTMIGNDGMTLLYVPAGEFLMGSTNTDTLAQDDEKPQHSVTLDAYWIDQTDVTNAMYTKCVLAGKCVSPNNTNYYSNSIYANYPVVYVSWNDAVEYCSWAGRRLPTEAEWEKAARGQNANIYPWGNDAPNKDLLNYNKNVGDITEVGKYPNGKSYYGAYDMAGNVWQWVDGWYDVYPGGDVSASSDFGQKYRVLRGGSWVGDDVHGVRSAYRGWNDFPITFNGIGFRCSRSP